jgi:hypothetical protein
MSTRPHSQGPSYIRIPSSKRRPPREWCLKFEREEIVGRNPQREGRTEKKDKKGSCGTSQGFPLGSPKAKTTGPILRVTFVRE